MFVTAHIGPDGLIELPEEVIEALGLAPGDRVLFRSDGGRAVITRVDPTDLNERVEPA